MAVDMEQLITWGVFADDETTAPLRMPMRVSRGLFDDVYTFGETPSAVPRRKLLVDIRRRKIIIEY